MIEGQRGGYPLGYSAREARRLEQQAGFLEGLTRDLFRYAGLRPGMRVLEVGCGMGDVSLLVAEAVGPTGHVCSVDRDQLSLERARTRALAARVHNIEFLQAELPDIGPLGKFDALVGRFVMIYFPDPAAVLADLVGRVKPEGIVAFLEPDFSQARSIPPTPVLTENLARLNAVFARCGFHPEIGLSIAQVFEAAGLAPSLLGTTAMEKGGGGFCPTWLASTVKSLVPAMVRTGTATEAEVAADTLEDRLRAEADATASLILGPLITSAWAIKPL